MSLVAVLLRSYDYVRNKSVPFRLQKEAENDTWRNEASIVRSRSKTTIQESDMIAIIDYGMGNLRSVSKAFEAVGHQAVVTRDSQHYGRAGSA